MNASSPLPIEPETSGRIVAVVVTFNRLAHVRETLERLETEGIDAIVVVDNGSTDGTRSWLENWRGSDRHVVMSETNLGGAGGFARGIEHTRSLLDPDWIVLMDDDSRPAPGAIGTFRSGDWDGVDGVAAAVFYPDGRICDMNRPLRNPFGRTRFGRGGFRIPDEGYDPAADPCPIDMATYVGLFLSRRAVETHPGPDPRLFIYGDDLLHTLSLSQAGFRLMLAPAIRFEHDCATLHGTERVYRPLWKVYYHHRNGVMLYKKAAGPAAWVLLAARLPRWWMASRLYGADAPAYRRMLRRAVGDGIRGRLDSPPPDVPAPFR